MPRRGNRLALCGLASRQLAPNRIMRSMNRLAPSGLLLRQLAPDRMPRRGNRLALCGLASRQLAPDRIRTGDPHLTMVVLYRLSYKGVECVSRYHIVKP